MSVRVATLLVVATLLASACGDGDTSAPTLITTTTTTPVPSSTVGTSTAPVDPPVRIEQVDCPDRLDRSDGLALACGVVTVPIDRTDASAGTTRITVATLAGYDTGFDTPVAVLQGGPGGASSEMGGWFPQQPFTQVFVDQRGTGFVGPDFDCPEIVDALGRVLATDSTEGGDLAQVAYDDCARRLDDDIVLRHTDSESHAADVVDVMVGLGYGRWVVYGVSYGSTIGLEILRDETPGVVGVILDGVYPPELDTDAGIVASAERAVDQIDAACAADSACRGYLVDGSFRSTVERVMADLDRSPMIVSVTGDEIGYDSGIDVVLDGHRVAELSFLLMYNESLLRYLPAVIGGLDERDASAARWLAVTGSRLLVSSQLSNDEGTYFAVQCHDRLPFTDGPGDDALPFGAAVAAKGLDAACVGWDREAAVPAVAAPVTASIPTLLLSGSFDPITPSDYADDVAARLGSATVVEQGGRGHGIWYGSDCIAGIVQQFVSDPARVLDTSCADDPVPVEWARP
ncbi:MAG: alpha/beta fold hydrolase [Acidimicrobiales bacterium]